MKPRLFRVVIPVSDMKRAVAFYSAVLQAPGVRVGPTRHYFDCGGTILACVDPAGRGGAHRPNPEHVYISVPELVATLERVRKAGPLGYDIPDQDAGIAVRPWGERSFYVQDPFGNPLCFVEAGTEFTG